MSDAPAMSRRYKVAEIDRMRESVRERMFRPITAFVQNDGARLQVGEYPPESYVEDRLRTYMMAGVSPEELAGVLGSLPVDFHLKAEPGSYT